MAVCLSRSLALAGMLLASHASAEEPHVVVRFAAGIADAEAARLGSAIRGQLRDAATVDIGENTSRQSPTCIVDLDRGGAGLLLRFTDAAGHPAGPPRVIPGAGEIGASEAATIIRTFLLATPPASAPPPDPAPETRAVPPAIAPTPPQPARGAGTGGVGGAETREAANRERAGGTTGTERPRGAANRDEAAGARGNGGAGEAPSRVRIGAFYTGVAYAAEIPWQSGARAEVLYAFLPGFYAGVGYAFHPARDVGNDAVQVSVSRHAAALIAGIERGRTMVFGADVGLGLDQTVRSAARTSNAFLATRGALNVGPTFALRVHGRWRPPGGAGLGLDVAPTLELAPTERSMIVDGPLPETLLSPAVARFRVDIGGTFDGF